jgi:L-asparagine oxygenase
MSKHAVVRRDLDTAQLHVSGFVLLSTSPWLSTLEVARGLGDVLHLEGIAEVQTLVPTRAEDVHKNRYSGLYGMESFPLHTDMAHWHIPPRYFLLRCVQAAQNVPTYVVHSRDVFGPEAEMTLKRAIFRPRRGQDGRLTCLRLREGDCYRWDPVFLRPVNELAVELRCRLLSRSADAPKHSVAFRESGDCMVIDNWKTLHGRAPVPRDAMQRKIERVYLDSIRT